MILEEFGIRTKDIYRKRLLEGYDDEDDEDEEEYDDPLNWTGSIEIDAIIYPTMKGTLDIDQEGPLYLLEVTLSLPAGNATLYDEFEFIVNTVFATSTILNSMFQNIFSIQNNLKITTPYKNFNEITSNSKFIIRPKQKYDVGFDVKYLNRTRWIKV